jgi:hypothetical protein
MNLHPAILHIDIETSPNLCWVWNLWEETVQLERLIEVQRTLSFAAKWDGEPAKDMQFYSIHDFDKGRNTVKAQDRMIEAAKSLLDEADIVVHYNGTRFDMPYLNREFYLTKRTPPSPYKQVDLYLTARKVFKFPSNKLQHISEASGLGGKISKADGIVFDLWARCMDGDTDAWKLMRKYNKRDVVLTEGVYHRMLPWIVSHPNLGAFIGERCCPACGSTHLQVRGYAILNTGRYPRYQCMNPLCGKYSRGTKSDQRTTLVNIAT